MAKVRLKLIMEKGLAVGSCGTGIPEQGTLEETKEEKAEIGSLLSWIRETFGDQVDISVIDPKNIFSLFDNFRYGIKGTAPAWILNGKKVFEGIPAREELEEALRKLL